MSEESRSKVEEIKAESRSLRGGIAEAFAAATTHVDEATYQLLKFHGMYQQDDRDLRAQLKRAGQEPHYQFMIRSKIPGGRLTAEQYLVHDELADAYGNGTLRITTRQGIQLHGVLKGDVRATLRAVNGVLVTTLGACGDVCRNVVACPAPLADRRQGLLGEYARAISDHLLPRSRAYHEIWLDGQQVKSADLEEGGADAEGGGQAEAQEPIYGKRGYSLDSSNPNM